MSSAKTEAFADDDIVIPEVAFQAALQPYCVYRVVLSANTSERRRTDFLNFLRMANLQTRDWQADFVVAGIDYTAFKYFHIVTYSSCANHTILKSIHGLSDRQEYSDAVVVPNSKLVSFAANQRGFVTSSEKFTHYRSRAALGGCLVGLTGTDLGRASEVRSFLLEVADMYRMSIADASLWNDEIYLLFGRQCDQKRELYSQIVFLALQNGFKMSRYLKRVDFDVSVEDYFRSSERGALLR
ncbi:MAG TPA: hypothetical protein VJX67_09105 [Blastocatellia bacterium]|nr:hypothetical protein [Blastocatellia bacterium]